MPKTKSSRKTTTRRKKEGWRSQLRQQYARPIIFILAFAIIGTAATIFTRANAGVGGAITGKGGACLDNNGGRLQNHNRITLWKCNGGKAQMWVVEKDGSIQTQGWCLDIPGASTASKVYVQLYKCNGTKAQKWTLGNNGAIVNPNSGLCLDARYGGTADGTRIWMWPCNGTAAQKWAPSKETRPGTPAPAPTPPAPTPTPPQPNPTPPQPAPTTPQPIGIGGNWKMSFQDEFTGSSIATSKWTPNWLGNPSEVTKPINSAEVSCYDPANANVTQGELQLRATKSSCLANDGKTYPYRSGMVQSNGKFNYTYGVAEARVWLPAGAGAWPAFWSTGQNWPTDGEIDTMEAYGNDTAEYHYHYAGCGGDCGPGGGVNIPGATSGWHTYATKWEPGKITWYYDGKQVWQYTTGITSKPLYLVVNLGILGKNWDTGQTIIPNLPYTYRVDYVRVWQ